jgi:very-short-patch-repair endonuclease
MTSLFNRQDQKNLRRTLRRIMPEPERRLWLRIKSKQLNGLKFRRQFGAASFVLDFYCPEIKLAVEIDGHSHGESRETGKDARREEALSALGIRVVRYDNEQVMKDIDGVMQDLLRHTSPIPSLQGGDQSDPKKRGSPLLCKEGRGEV